MNAVTQTETRAIETAAPLEVADPSKNLILVPLSQLLPRRSKRNARKTPRLSIPELAASIAASACCKISSSSSPPMAKQYEVVAGDRRLTALKLLAKKKRILPTTKWRACWCRCFGPYRQPRGKPAARADAPGRPVRGVRRTGQEGRPIEDIAADFGVTPLVVQRRLKLANVSPRLLADYRAGAVTWNS